MLDATLGLAQGRGDLRQAALGDPQAATAFIGSLGSGDQNYPPPVNKIVGGQLVTTLDDHDGLTDKLRFARRIPRYDTGPKPMGVDELFWPLRPVPGCALLLLTVGIPCLYYGTEQAMAGPALPDRRRFPLDGWPDDGYHNDRYLREAMFGPAFPRPAGGAGVPAVLGGVTEDTDAIGSARYGTVGKHVFRRDHAVYRRVQVMTQVRAGQDPLRHGKQYYRPSTVPREHPASGRAVGNLLAWSRLTDTQEVVVVVNTATPRSADGGQQGDDGVRTAQVLVDADMNQAGRQLQVLASTAHCDGGPPRPDSRHETRRHVHLGRSGLRRGLGACRRRGRRAVDLSDRRTDGIVMTPGRDDRPGATREPLESSSVRRRRCGEHGQVAHVGIGEPMHAQVRIPPRRLTVDRDAHRAHLMRDPAHGRELEALARRYPPRASITSPLSRRCRRRSSETFTRVIVTVKPGSPCVSVIVLPSLSAGTSSRNTISHQVPDSSAFRIVRNSSLAITASWFRFAPSSTTTL